jgi:hypothetical protein
LNGLQPFPAVGRLPVKLQQSNMTTHPEMTHFKRTTATENFFKYLRLLFISSIVMFFLSSCNYQMYYVNKTSDGVPVKEVYKVTYSTVISEGNTAKISYINKDGKTVSLKKVTRTFEVSDNYVAGQKMLFKVIVKKKDQVSDLKLSSAITIDGKIFAEQVQTGKNAIFRVAFKLP